MIGRHHRQGTRLQPRPQAVLMPLVAERRRHHPPRGMVPVGVEILAFVQRQVLDQRLAPDPLALRPRPADRLVAVLATDMHDIQRHARHVGHHDGAVGGLALDLRGTGIGVGLGAGVALGQQPGGQFGHHVAVLGMDQGHAAQIAHPAEAAEQLVVVHHQRALVGHEMLEAGDAAIHHRLHLVPNLLAPPGHGHVEAVIAMRPPRLVVPHPQRIQQPLPGRGQGEVHHHRRSARQRRPRAAVEIVGGIGAHEGHLQMRMRVDAARHDIAAGRVQNPVAGQPVADGGDAPALDQNVGLAGKVGGDDGAVPYNRAHPHPFHLCSNIPRGSGGAKPPAFVRVSGQPLPHPAPRAAARQRPRLPIRG